MRFSYNKTSSTVATLYNSLQYISSTTNINQKLSPIRNSLWHVSVVILNNYVIMTSFLAKGFAFKTWKRQFCKHSYTIKQIALFFCWLSASQFIIIIITLRYNTMPMYTKQTYTQGVMQSQDDRRGVNVQGGHQIVRIILISGDYQKKHVIDTMIY